MNLNDFSFTIEDMAAASAASTNPYLADPAKGLELITHLVAHPPTGKTGSQWTQLECLHKLIHSSYVNLAARDNYPAEALAYRDLQTLEASLEDMVIFPDLANKTVIGVGGGFSAGKSRFLNTLVGTMLLPEALEPTTAIPTFLTGGTSEDITALNTFKHQITIDAQALEAISHRFHDYYKKNFGREVGFSHILKLLMVRRPGFPWNNLAFLDTPGYSKAEAEGAHTDEGLALRQLSEADRVVWLINARNGSIRQDDIEFLRTLAPSRPIFVVITQSDLVNSSSIQGILAHTAESLNKAAIAVAGIMSWAAPTSQNHGKQLGGADFIAWLESMNKEPKRTTKRITCARILDGHILHNSNALASNKDELAALNELLPLAQGLPANRLQTLNSLTSGLRHDQKRLAVLVGDFTALKEEFNSVISKIVGKIAIDEEVKKGHELHHAVKREEVKHPVSIGDEFNAVVISVKSDIKRVMLTLGENMASIGIPFSIVRSGLGIDPMVLTKGNLFRCKVGAMDGRHVTFVITDPNETNSLA